MTKSTAAVIMISVAKLPPWGDDGWRFAGVMQLVHDGPDWLYAQWPVLDGEEHHGSERFATLVLREDAHHRAEDIAVMAFALLQVPEWQRLMPWWEPSTNRESLAKILQSVLTKYAGLYKFAIMQTSSSLGPDLLNALRALGFDVVEFVQVEAMAQER